MQLDVPRLGSEPGSNVRLSETDASPIGAGSWPDGPILRLKDLLKLLQVSRSKAYELMKTDPDFPTGIPLYDCEQSPKFYWTYEAMAWLKGRATKFRNRQKGN